MTMLEFLHVAAKEARDKLLQQQLRPKRIPTEVPIKKRPSENGPNRFSLHLSNNRNAQPNREDDFLRKKPMAFDDGEQERAQKKVKFNRNFSEKELECRPTDAIVVREPNPFPDFPGKLKNNVDDNNKGKKPDKGKKRKRADSHLWSVKTREPLPEDVRRKIEEKARLAGEEDLKIVLVIQKVLETSDVKRQQNRVTIPLAQLENKFLTPQQEEELEQKIGSHYAYVTVPIIEPSGRVQHVQMRRWNVGKRSISYVLNGDWKHVVEYNQLQEHQTMQLWAFWIKGMLNFAFLVLPGGGPPPVSNALVVFSDRPQTGCLIRRRFDEASTSTSGTQPLTPQPLAVLAADIDVPKEVGSGIESESEVITATSENEVIPATSENEVDNCSTSRSQDSKPRWTFDLNEMPEVD